MGHGMDISSLNTFNPTAALFGSSNNALKNSSNGWMTGLNDLKMIQSGTYKRALHSVYDKQDKDTVKKSVSDAISTDAEKTIQSWKDDEVDPKEIARQLNAAGSNFNELF